MLKTALTLAAAGSALANPDVFPDMEMSTGSLESWLGHELTELTHAGDVAALRSELIRAAADYMQDEVSLPRGMDLGDYPYFSWIPDFMGAAVPDGDAVQWEGSCFKKNSMSAVTNDDGSVTVTLSASKGGLLCSDNYLLASFDKLAIKSVSKKGDQTLTWEFPATEALQWDLANKGVRAFRFHDGWMKTLGYVFKTLELLEPELTKPVADKFAKINVDYLAKYTNNTMVPRQDIVDLDESMFRSGDFLGVIRLDGLDPMLAWAMGQGASTGHTTMALWIDETMDADADPGLYIVESTVTDSYWPTNGIQKTPYKTWIEQARAAGYNTVHLPLNDEYAAKFDAAATYEFFQSIEGVDYGYQNMLWGWIDLAIEGQQAGANYPCVPGGGPCLSWELVETVLFGFVDAKVTPAFGDQFYLQAFNHRLGTEGLRAAELFQHAGEAGIVSHDIPTIVEDASWLYNVTRDGVYGEYVQSVCCVAVCRFWQAGGLFDGLDVNCPELTNTDDYMQNMFIVDPENRPQACIDNDPNNALCQITGNWTLNLNHLNSIPAPYDHMRENCGSDFSIDC